MAVINAKRSATTWIYFKINIVRAFALLEKNKGHVQTKIKIRIMKFKTDSND